MKEIDLIVLFGVVTLLIFTFTYFFYERGGAHSSHDGLRRRPFNITFARLFGLITVAFIGASLTFTDIPTELATSAFTLLGTIAGYLAGASPTATPVAAEPSPGLVSTETVL
jgi:hypothetical protein